MIQKSVSVSTMCKRPICGHNSILKVNGECEACPEDQRAVAGGYYCDDAHDHELHEEGHNMGMGGGHRLLSESAKEDDV